MNRDELLQDHMLELKRFGERSLELLKPVSWCLAMIYAAQIGILGIAILMISDPHTIWMGLLAFGDAIATITATVKMTHSYDRALRPRPEPVDSIEEDSPC